MTKKLTSLFLSVLFAVLLCTPVFAESKPFPETQLDYVTDKAELLTEQEIQTLEDKAEQLATEYTFGVYIITVDDISEYMDDLDMETAAEQLYLSYDLGKGSNQSGLLLLMSMAERDWALFAFGYGNTAFTDYGKGYLSDQFLDDFKNDNWYSGFTDYQTTCGQMLDTSLNGSPVDVDNVPPSPYARLYGIITCVVLGLLIAFMVTVILKRQLKSVAHGTQAEAFIAAGGLKLTDQYDRYTHTTTSRVYDPPQKSSSSSGGTTTRSSGGSSASGKF